MSDSQDRAFMDRALFHAARGRGRTTPNPIVGAVVVSAAGVVVGQGAHLQAGGPHAEVVALDAAGPAARGGTIYCTLEPCVHTGRTGPCVERIVAAGVGRVVSAIRDANPIVSGRGVAYLRARGVEVTEGVGCEPAARQHAPFFTWVTRHRPFVTSKAAVTRDGFVGAPDRRVALTGPEANRFFQRQRAEVDAIAVGAGTILVDDPALTARGAYRHRPLTRVIFDWRGRTPGSARVFSTLSAGPVIMMVSAHAVAAAHAQFEDLAGRGVLIEPWGARQLVPMLEWLAAREVTSLLVEGGPSLHRAFAEAGVVDRVQRVVVPRELGSGVPLATDMAADGAGDRTVTALGEDRLIEFDVHRTDRDHRTH